MHCCSYHLILTEIVVGTLYKRITSHKLQPLSKAIAGVQGFDSSQAIQFDLSEMSSANSLYSEILTFLNLHGDLLTATHTLEASGFSSPYPTSPSNFLR